MHANRVIPVNFVAVHINVEKLTSTNDERDQPQSSGWLQLGSTAVDIFVQLWLVYCDWYTVIGLLWLVYSDWSTVIGIQWLVYCDWSTVIGILHWSPVIGNCD